MEDKNKQKKIFIASVVILVLALGFITYQYYLINEEVKDINESFNSTYENTGRIIEVLNNKIENLNIDRNLLAEALQDEQNRNREFEEQIISIQGTLGDLERLNETDPELLKKYSKVYFLSEHYTPSNLTEIPSDYIYEGREPQEIHAGAYPYLRDMITRAEEDGIDLSIISAYRSFGTQIGLKDRYTVVYGAGTANRFSAEQGYSEHQLGTTVDFTTQGLNGALDGFENTEAYEWLLDNAYKFGFVLSYPEGNTYYQFEPWHWRFVGVTLASDLNKRGENFYDMDQREIDKYLIDIFE